MKIHTTYRIPDRCKSASTTQQAARWYPRGILECGSLPPLWSWPMTVGCENGGLELSACSARPKRWQATALQDRVERIFRVWNGGLHDPLCWQPVGCSVLHFVL